MVVLRPGLEEFEQVARPGTVVPVVWEDVVDLDTPITLYYKLRGLGAAYLLESAEQGGRVGRFSFIGIHPFAGMEATLAKGATSVRMWDDHGEQTSAVRPTDALRAMLAQYHPSPSNVEVPPFWGGAVGFFGYEVIHSLECIPWPEESSPWPAAAFMLAEDVVVIDHFHHRIRIIHSARIGGDARTAYHRAVSSISEIRQHLAGRGDTPPVAPSRVTGADPLHGFRSNTERSAYEAMVRSAKEHIRRGDIFQVVLSQRFTRSFGGDPLQVYRFLRSANPSPYMFYLDFGRYQLVGASPEMLLRVQAGTVETRPIAGTRRRGRDAGEDEALEAELGADPKERAEHVMLVDLGRNDLGRVAEPGTVRVPVQMVVERFSTVMHLVSEVRGQLRTGMDAIAALEACFPAGTLSGAPKVRAMEIISELEGRCRGMYGGAVAYFGFDGNADTAIIIRSAAVGDGTVVVQAGAGIVADSVPEREYQECIDKASSVLVAVEAADGGR